MNLLGPQTSVCISLVKEEILTNKAVCKSYKGESGPDVIVFGQYFHTMYGFNTHA